LNDVEVAIILLQILDGYKLLAMEHGEEHEAGINAPIMDSVVCAEFAKDNSTRTAVAFGTTFFYSFMIWEAPEIIENRCGGRKS
jgi:hypothetical protein